MSEIVDLLALAWERCEADIYDVARLLIGGMLGLLMLAAFTFMNLYYLQPYYEAPTAGTFGVAGMSILYAFYISVTYAYVTTACMMTFLAIVTCLFEYALSFTIVCYYYDNCSWVVPNTIRDTVIFLWKTMVQRNNQSKDYNVKWRDSLKTEVAAIRAGTYKKEE